MESCTSVEDYWTIDLGGKPRGGDGSVEVVWGRAVAFALMLDWSCCFFGREASVDN